MTWVIAAVLAGASVGRLVAVGPPDAVTAPVGAVTLDRRIADLEAATSATPGDLRGWQELGSLYVARAARTGDPATYPLAEHAFERADAIAARAPETLVGRGTLALARHEFGAALELGEEVLRARPRDTGAHGIVVDALVELGRYDEAAERLQAMLDLRPDLPALSRASYLRELHGDLTGAVQAMQQARAAGGTSYDLALVTALLGDLRLSQGDLDGAAGAYAQAVALEEGLPRALLGQARVTAARGDVGAAVAGLEQLLERAPLPEAAVLLGDLRRSAGDDAAAETDELVRALATLQREAGQVVDLELAVFEADRGDPATAVQLARSAYDRRPTIHAADAVAWALLRTGDAAAAVPYADEALRLGTQDARLRWHAAAAFAAAGDEARARTELEVALALDPTFALGHREQVGALAARLGVPVPW